MTSHNAAVTTTQLRRFVVLADELTFTRATRRLHNAHQVLSSQIMQLELEVGTALFTRSTHYVAIMLASAELPIAAGESLDALDRGVCHALRDARRQRSERRIGFLTHAKYLQIVALHAPKARHPEVKVTMAEPCRQRPVERTAVRETNVALCLHPPKHPDPEVEMLHEEPHVCLLPTGHSLSRRAELGPPDFIGLPAIVTEGHDLDPVIKACSYTHMLAD